MNTESNSGESEPQFSKEIVTRLQLLQGMRVSIVEGTLALALATLTTGSVLTGLALFLGATSIQIGVISGIPALGNFIQIISPIWVERLKSRRLYVALAAGIHRTLLSLSVLTIFLPVGIRVNAFLIILTISFISASLSTVAWGTWMSDMVPEGIRGRYFAKRNAIINFTFIIIAPFAGHILDKFPGSTGFLILYAIGLLCAISNSSAFFWQYEPPYKPEKQKTSNLWRTYLLAFKNRQFISIVLFYTFWTFARTIADPFYNVFMIQELKVPYFQIKIFETISFVVLIISSFFWGYISDKLGNKTVTRFCSAAFTLTPLLWILNTPNNYVLIPCIYVISGLLSAGMNLASFNLFLGSSPRKNKSVYLSLWSAITGLVGFIGPIFGGWLIKLLTSYHLRVGDFRLGSLQLVFCLSALLTLLCSLTLPDIKESKQSISWTGMQRFRLLNPFVLFGLIYNVIIFNQSREERIRLRASRAFGKLRSPLVVQELLQALDDPSPAVREQAALSLGEIGNPEAVDALIAKLQSPEENIQPEAAQALGLIGNPKAVDPLLNRLDDPDPTVRASVVEALGNIADDRAKEALFERLQKETDPKLFPALVNALSKLRETRIVQIALQRLDQFGSAVVRRQILDSLAYLLEDDDSFYEVTGLDFYEQDTWISKRLSIIEKRVMRRKGFIPERQSLESILQLIHAMNDHFSREKYDSAVKEITDLCKWIQSLPSSTKNHHTTRKDNYNRDLVQLNLNAIQTLIKLNNSVNLERDEVLFMIVALDRIVEELMG